MRPLCVELATLHGWYATSLSKLLLQAILGGVEISSTPDELVRYLNALLLKLFLHAQKELVKIAGFIVLAELLVLDLLLQLVVNFNSVLFPNLADFLQALTVKLVNQVCVKSLKRCWLGQLVTVQNVICCNRVIFWSEQASMLVAMTEVLLLNLVKPI